MTSEKQLHVLVAEAVSVMPRIDYWLMNREETGIYVSFPTRQLADEDLERHLRLYPKGLYAAEGAHVVEHLEYPHYDMDWAATGPLIERLGIMLLPPLHGADQALWTAVLGRDDGAPFIVRPTPLIAVCVLILALRADGTLKGLLATDTLRIAVKENA